VTGNSFSRMLTKRMRTRFEDMSGQDEHLGETHFLTPWRALCNAP
jgi:hypothetical protein